MSHADSLLLLLTLQTLHQFAIIELSHKTYILVAEVTTFTFKLKVTFSKVKNLRRDFQCQETLQKTAIDF